MYTLSHLSDASGVIKLWDVRNYQCVQTIRKDATIQPLTGENTTTTSWMVCLYHAVRSFHVLKQ